MIAELDALDDNAVVRRNTWGLDLAGLGGNPTSITADYDIHIIWTAEDYFSLCDGKVIEARGWPFKDGEE